MKTKRSYNYSAIVSARKCNRLYKFLYIDQLKPPGPQSGDMQFGTGIHLGVETYLEGDNGNKAFDVFWDIEKGKENRYGRYGWDALKGMASILLTRFEKLHLKKFRVHQMEQRLYGQLPDGTRIEGTPDFIGEFEGDKTVLDFKTSGMRYNKDKLIPAEQLYLYEYLARTQTGYQANSIAYQVFIKGAAPSIQTQTMPLDEAHSNEVLSDFGKECQDLERKEEQNLLLPNRSNCIMGDTKCEFYSRCYAHLLPKPEEPSGT